MGQYLEKFNNTINQRQANQILKLLNKQRNQGQIRSINEFSKKLEGLVRDLTSTKLTPSLKLFMANDGELIDSEQYNFMLERLEDDLVAAFEETNNINEVQQSHQSIIRDVILKNLKFGIAELESKVDLYEFINKDKRGFDQAIFSTFRESKENRVTRGQTTNRALFTDPRTNTLFKTSEDNSIELVGERLSLPAKISTKYNISNVRQIFDDNTRQSELIVEPPGTEIKNIIDNTNNTYWIQSLLFNNEQSSVKVKLELTLGVIREISFIQVEPILNHDMILESVDYVDNNKVIQSIISTDQVFKSSFSIPIAPVATNKIILTFRNENPRLVQFEYDPKNPDDIFKKTLSQPAGGYSPDIQSINEELKTIISSENIKSLIGITPATYTKSKYYDYTFGIDNIYLGVTEFTNKGTYVSTPLKTKNAGQIGLRVLENRPYQDITTKQNKYTTDTYNNSNDDNYYLGSIEYWILKQNLNAQGNTFNTKVFPILPLDTNEIHHERLLLTSKSNNGLTYNDQGKTLFFTNATATEGNIRVFRNGVLLNDETGNASATDGWKHIQDTPVVDKSPNTGSPMQFKIQIINPTASDIYTVSYTPLFGSTKLVPNTLSQYDSIGGLQVVDLVGDLTARLGPGKIVDFEVGTDNNKVVQSNIYLIVVLRQNTADETLTPFLEEYTLLLGSKKDNKFEDL